MDEDRYTGVGTFRPRGEQVQARRGQSAAALGHGGRGQSAGAHEQGRRVMGMGGKRRPVVRRWAAVDDAALGSR